MKITEHFDSKELKINELEFKKIINLINIVLKILEPVRLYTDTPIIITSALRTVEENKKVGGVKNSQHLTGNAIDFILKDKAKLQSAINFIQEELEFDQLIHEHKHGAEWLHVSLVKEGNRQEFLEIWK